MDVLAFRRWCRQVGLRAGTVAERLRVRAGTLQAWEARWRRDRMRVRPRGRPRQEATPEQRNLVLVALYLLGPGVGVPTLRALFPGLARSALCEIVARYRRVYRRRRRGLRHALRWTVPGTVWAMDFTEPPLPIDGEYPYILVVRDLASGKLLAAVPTRGADASAVCAVLTTLFLAHGAPLVLKSDNGSHFVNEEVGRLLAAWRTMALRSPPWTPSYNGACEAGIGGLKTRAHDESARQDRPGQWTCDDVETARLVANETARPSGIAAPTPDQAWRSRVPVEVADRHRFAATVDRLRPEARRDLGHGPATPSQVDRVAITRALIERDYLQLRRRRFTLSIAQRAVRNFK